MFTEFVAMLGPYEIWLDTRAPDSFLCKARFPTETGLIDCCSLDLSHTYLPLFYKHLQTMLADQLKQIDLEWNMRRQSIATPLPVATDPENEEYNYQEEHESHVKHLLWRLKQTRYRREGMRLFLHMFPNITLSSSLIWYNIPSRIDPLQAMFLVPKSPNYIINQRILQRLGQPYDASVELAFIPGELQGHYGRFFVHQTVLRQGGQTSDLLIYLLDPDDDTYHYLGNMSHDEHTPIAFRQRMLILMAIIRRLLHIKETYRSISNQRYYELLCEELKQQERLLTQIEVAFHELW